MLTSIGAFFMPENQKGGASMLFTEGKLQGYERMMQQKPDFGRNPIKTMKERDCPHCLHFNQKAKKCGLRKCAMFKD
jgi:hypothetical protein